MLEINTIKDWFALTSEQRSDICRNIKSVERLKLYLESLNGKENQERQPEWVPCKKCGTRGYVLEENVRRNNADIHASQIHKCLKFIWFSCTDYVNEGRSQVGADLRLIFDHGHSLHHMLQGYGRKGAWCNPSSYNAEVTIIPDGEEASLRGERVLEEAIKYRVRSSVDAVIWNYIVPGVRDLGEVSIRIIHEYKSIGPGKPKKDGTMYGGFADLRGPKLEHKWQSTIYMHCLNVPLTSIIYYNKGYDQLMDFVTPYDPITWNFVKNKIEAVLDYAERGVEPPWERTSAAQNPDECKTCDYKHICCPPKDFMIIDRLETTK